MRDMDVEYWKKKVRMEDERGVMGEIGMWMEWKKVRVGEEAGT